MTSAIHVRISNGGKRRPLMTCCSEISQPPAASVLIHLVAQKESDGVNRVTADALDIGDRVTRGTVSLCVLTS